MKICLTFLMLFASLAGVAQNEVVKGGGQSVGTVFGTIRMPALQSLHIELEGQNDIRFENAEAFDQGKVMPRFFTATLISNVPYMVDVMTSSEFFSMDGGSGLQVPVSIMRLRNSQTGAVIPMAAKAQPLVISTTDKIRSVHHFDLELNPGWNYPGGQYNVSVVFTLTPQ